MHATTTTAIVPPTRTGGRVARMVHLALTAEDYADLARLSDGVRDDVRRWVAALGRVTPPVGCALERVAVEMGVSVRTARRKWDAAQLHGWRGLVDGAREPASRAASIPDATLEHWRKMAALNQRAARPAYRALVRAFFAGEPIPGVAPDVSRKTLPRGWSYANFMRHAPSKFELTALRIGRSAARSMGPLVYTTRRDLWPGSHYLFDDMVHDHFVNVLDRRQAGRPMEFHALDLRSACKFAWGMRVRTENEITGRMEGLREENMRAIVAVVLGRDGYHGERGTEMVVEHGTAAIREDLERLLYDLTGGRVTVRRSGIEGDPAHVGQYAGRGKGNFRFKAALESLGNLIHNEMGFLPGQAGLSTDRRPEELHGLLRHNDALVAAFAGLAVSRPDLAGALRMPVMSDRQFVEVAMEVYRRINDRTDHRLEGWDLWVRPDERDPSRVRRMSPTEVWVAGRPELTRLRSELVALVLYRDAAEERTVRGGEIEFRDSEVSSDELRFACTGHRDGEKFQAVLNPFDPERLFLFDARRRFVGVAPRIARVSRADHEAVCRAMGDANHRLAKLLEPVAALGSEIARQRIADARHNAAVLEEAGGKAARSAEARAARVGAAAMAELDVALAAEPLPPADPVVDEEFDLTGPAPGQDIG